MEQPSSALTVPSWRTLVRWTLLIGVIWLVSWMLWSTGTSLIPFILGLVFAYLLLPLVSFLSRWLPRWAAIVVIYLGGIGALVAAVMFIFPPVINQVTNFFGELPDFWQNTAQPFVQDQLTWYNEQVPESVRSEIDTQVTNATNTLKENASTYVQNIGSTLLSGISSIFRTLIFLAGFLIVPFWLFYVLLDADKGKRAFDRLLPEKLRADIWSMLTIVDRVFAAYIRGQLTLGLIVGVMSYVGLWGVDLIFGVEVPYKLLLSVVAGFTELIPVIGPILGAIPAVIVGLTQSVTAALIIGGLYVLIQQVENHILVPRIIGSVVEIHAAVLMVLLVVSAELAGLIGVIFSAPLAAVGRDIYMYLNGRLRQPDDPRYLPAGALPIRASEVKDMDG